MIGVFDSGSGGLTILAALQKALPDQAFLYLGDHGNSPYGNKSPEEIYKLTEKGVRYLFSKGCTIVLLACNTASAVALRRLQQDWLPENCPDKRVLGVLVPMVEAITGLKWDRDNPGISQIPAQNIAVFGTQRTVESGSYAYEVARRSPKSIVLQQSCPTLASAIEEGADETALQNIIRQSINDLLFQAHGAKLDAAILACTHYPLVEHIFRSNLPEKVTILSQPDVTSQALKTYLERHAGLASQTAAETRYLTTGEPGKIKLLGRYNPCPKAYFQTVTIT